jgi:hypothetical protein
MKGGFAANKNLPACEKLPSLPEVVGHDLRVVPQGTAQWPQGDIIFFAQQKKQTKTNEYQ